MSDAEQEAMKAKVLAGVCPFCDAGPYKVVAIHIRAMHGLGTRELRDLVGLTYKASIIDPELREVKREISKGLNLAANLPIDGARGRPKQLSKRAREILSDRGRAMQSFNVESRRPHPCSVCGVILPVSTGPRTCSPECKMVARERANAKSSETRTGRKDSPSTRERKRQILRAINPNPPIPHPCPICETVVPTAARKTCSTVCANESARRVKAERRSANGL